MTRVIYENHPQRRQIVNDWLIFISPAAMSMNFQSKAPQTAFIIFIIKRPACLSAENHRDSHGQ